MIKTSTNPTVRAWIDSSEHTMARAVLRKGRQKVGRTLLDGDDPEHARLRRMVPDPCSIKVVGALRCRRTAINGRISPNGGLVQVGICRATGTVDCAGISAVPRYRPADQTRQLAASHHPKFR
ncbi:MAG: hypothetical protein QOI01_1683 [Mycobacterium sp.]|jgi:hypothetical protein|nr:hypothetical protein [Mycobacterium sp.]